MNDILEVKNLSISFVNRFAQAKEVVSDVSFSLKQGEVLGIVGESGSGKSVTALSILGLLPFPKARLGEKSKIYYKNIQLNGLSETELQKIRGGKIGFVFQEPMSSLNPLHKIGRQIAETILLHQNVGIKAARQKTLRLLKMVGIKNARTRMDAFPYELSGGQRQRVMIAMAIANEPDILIADEPTTALDVTIQKQILDLLLELKKKMNMSVLFISHNLNVVRNFADRVCVMKNGKIVEQGTVEDIFQSPKNSYTKTLIYSNNILNKNNIFYKENILRVENLNVVFPLKKNFWGRTMLSLQALKDFNLTLQKGKILGIVGESGSGKSTFALSLVGLNKYLGNIYINNQDVKTFSKQDKARMQIVFQDPYNSLDPKMTIKEIIQEGLDIHFPKMPEKQKYEQVKQVVFEVGLNEEDLAKYPHEFSGGQRQRVALARALILKPSILILDEPTSALDVEIQKHILELLLKIQAERNLTYIFISHDMNVVKNLSDEILVLKDGQIVEMGKTEDVFNHPQNDYTKNLIAASF